MTADSRCAAGDRCAGYDHREGVPAERDGHPVLCEADLAAGERAVPLLVRDYADLEQQLPLSSSRGDGQPGGSAELRVPLNLGVEALQRKIWWVLTAWEEVIRDYAQLSDAPRLVRDGAAVQRAAMILSTRIRLLAQVPPVTLLGYPYTDSEEMFRLGSVEYAELPGWRGVIDMHRLHGQALAAQGLTDARPELCDGVPCPGCDLKMLYRVPGSTEVECLSCRRHMSEDEYRRWTGIVAAAVHREDAEFENVPGGR